MSSPQKVLFYISAYLFICTNNIAQNASGYNFTSSTRTYANLSSSATLVPGHTNTSNDAISTAIPIGFTFKFAGINYSQLYVSSNGWLSFANTGNSQPLNEWIQMNQMRPTIFPLWDDLINKNRPRYLVTGTAPNRIFKLEYLDSQWGTNSNINMSFQVWLYETSNIIEFNYTSNNNNPVGASASIGIFDHNGKHLALNNAGASPTAENGPLATNINSKPSNNRLYTFTPPQYNAQFNHSNLGTQIWCAGETRNISVSVTNTGTQAWTNSSPDINIAAKWDTDASYTFKVNANGLAAGQTQNFNLTVQAPPIPGVNHLTFDVISEGICEFSSNTGACKSDNTDYPSGHIIIKEIPNIDAGNNIAICGGSTQLNANANGIYEPIIVFTENFESYSNAELLSNSGVWRFTNIQATNTKWQITEDCSPINGTKCLNMNDGLGTDCDYRWGIIGITQAFRSTPINASGYSNLSLNFKWKGFGANGDYGKVLYSTNGTTWTEIGQNLNFKNNWSNYNNLQLPASLNNQSFYIGFKWYSDGGSGAAPGLAIDDIMILGNTGIAQPVSYTWTPNTYLSNTNTLNPIATPSSSITYQLQASSSGCSSTDSVRIRVDEPSSAPTNISGLGTYCVGSQITLQASGATLKGTSQYEWFSNTCGGTAIQNGTQITQTLQQSRTYYVRASANGACPPSSCINGTVNIPSAGNTLALNGDSAKCFINQNGMVHFYEPTEGRLIASINSHGQNLGEVKVVSYVENSPIQVNDCFDPNPNFTTTTLQRHWVIKPEIQPSAPVTIQLPYYHTEYSQLASIANANANLNDDVSPIVGALHLSKYSGSTMVNNNPNDNCWASSGNINVTTIHSATNNHNTTPSFYPQNIPNGHFSSYQIGSFSEFWLHGSSNNSPLPIQLKSFEAHCKDAKLEIYFTTSSEQNNSHFLIEESENMNDWKTLTQVAGSGNSNEDIHYSFTDLRLDNRSKYIRLKQVDFNGNEETFAPQFIDCKENIGNSVSIFPNPFKEMFQVDFTSDKYSDDGKLQIIDMSGRVVYENTQIIQEGKNSFIIHNLQVQPGVYLLKVSTNSEQLFINQIIKHQN